MKDKRKLFYLCLFLAAAFLPLNGCSWFGDDPDNESNGNSGSSVGVTVSPSSVSLAKGTTQQFSATVTNSYSQSVTWSVEGNSSPATTISREGLLSVAGNENSRTLTVKAAWSSYGDTASGTATVTVAIEGEIPSNLKITRPGKTGLNLSWSAVNNAANYKIYRSTNGKDYSHLADASAASYNDTAVAAGSFYYYAVSAVVNGLETGKSAVVFGFAEEYFALPVFVDRRIVPITGRQKHYYRFPVTLGESCTITWENGESRNADGNVRISVWQNDGTAVFTDSGYYARGGYTDPLIFDVTAAGYVTIEMRNERTSDRFNYMAYCLRKSNIPDTGVVSLPPAPVTGIKVTSPLTSSITLAWDTVPDATGYNIYRSPTQTGTPGYIGPSDSISYIDNNVAADASYYYTIAPVNADGKEGVWVQGAFAVAAVHYSLPTYASSQLLNLSANSKHYYRIAVITGQSYTITWQNGSSQNTNGNLRVSVWQNDGTAVFTDNGYYARGGYTDPLVFTATATGFVTVEVKNKSNSTGYDYKIYH